MSLSLIPEPVTRYPSCLSEEKSLNGDPILFTKFTATQASVANMRKVFISDAA